MSKNGKLRTGKSYKNTVKKQILIITQRHGIIQKYAKKHYKLVKLRTKKRLILIEKRNVNF